MAHSRSRQRHSWSSRSRHLYGYWPEDHTLLQSQHPGSKLTVAHCSKAQYACATVRCPDKWSLVMPQDFQVSCCRHCSSIFKAKGGATSLLRQTTDFYTFMTNATLSWHFKQSVAGQNWQNWHLLRPLKLATTSIAALQSHRIAAPNTAGAAQLPTSNRIEICGCIELSC